VDVWKQFDHNIITHSAAHHLMAVDDLIQKFGYARVSDVARLLNITRGSVSISLKPMKEAGLIVQDENRHLQLSPSGQQLVDAIKAKRLLVQRLLADVLGVNPEQAEIDACKMEHLISSETAGQLVAFLRYVDSDQPQKKAFLAAWNAFETNCGHEPGECPICEGDCMASAVQLGANDSEEHS
jgi:DtxR family Mn-dependent transcriptional regulator